MPDQQGCIARLSQKEEEEEEEGGREGEREKVKKESSAGKGMGGAACLSSLHFQTWR